MSIDDDFAHRELCPDGACIGVIGPEGRCKLCGTVSPTTTADPRHRAMDLGARIAAEDDDEGDEDVGADVAGRSDDVADRSDDDPDFDDRELCPDGACVGVLGPDRRCKVCGASPVVRPG